MPQEIPSLVEALLGSTRVAVLSTVGPQGPWCSQATYLPAGSWTDLYLCLSDAAEHTANLRRHNGISLIAEADGPQKNPLALRRLTVAGTAAPFDRAHDRYGSMAEAFVARTPHAQILFDLPDSRLWHVTLTRAAFIGGFGAAFVATRDEPARWRHQGRRDTSSSR
jgi:hypothetical protein